VYTLLRLSEKTRRCERSSNALAIIRSPIHCGANNLACSWRARPGIVLPYPESTHELLVFPSPCTIQTARQCPACVNVADDDTSQWYRASFNEIDARFRTWPNHEVTLRGAIERSAVGRAARLTRENPNTSTHVAKWRGELRWAA